MRTTHTLATLEIDHAAWSDIRARIIALGPDYAHMLLDDEGGLDMTGIMLAPGELSAPQVKLKEKAPEQLTEAEENILDLLVRVMREFRELPGSTDDYGNYDVEDFRYAVCILQRHIMARPARREYNNRPA